MKYYSRYGKQLDNQHLFSPLLVAVAKGMYAIDHAMRSLRT